MLVHLPRRHAAIWLLLCCALAVLVVEGVLSGRVSPDRTGVQQDAGAAAPGASDGQPRQEAPGRQGEEQPGQQAGASGDPTADGAAADDVSEIPATPPTGDEQKQPGEEGFALPGLRDQPEKQPAHLFAAPPSDASATGRVVKGYPSRLIPAPRGTRVLSTEVTSEGRVVRATYEGRCRCTTDRVVGFYERHLGKLGLEGSKVRAVGGSKARVYADARHAITLTVRPDGNSLRFSLFIVTTAKDA